MKKQMKLYYIFFLVFILNISSNYGKRMSHKRSRKISVRNKIKYRLKVTNDPYLEFMVGVGIGYGLSAEGIEELKKCFEAESEKNVPLVDIFLEKTGEDNQKVSNYLNMSNKKEANSFLSNVYQLFSNFTSCAPLKDTLFSFIKSKVINWAIKGLTFAAGGVWGLLIKGGYDMYSIISEINYFNQIKSEQPDNYKELGATVGRIISKVQNLGLKRRIKKF